MRLATDYVHPTSGRGFCRVRVFLPSDPERDMPVVVCTELPDRRGRSVANAAERIAGSVIDALGLPVPLVWIEHRPPKGTDGRSETFDLVTFGHYEVREIVRAEEGSTKEIGPPSWKRIDRESVEALVGQPLIDRGA
ncbi:MAG: hypothetical protein M3Q60_15240 [Actinomycetota bacterium]|nr:hypothetical protein [Actinomycetota bacterium]